MVVGAPSQRPVVLPLAFGDRQIVDAGMTAAHQALLIKLPVLVPVGAEPVPRVVVPFVCEPDRDTRLMKRPDLFYQAVIEFLRPLPLQKLDDLLAAIYKLHPVAPDAIDAVCEGYPCGVSRIPGIFGHTNLLYRRLVRERWQRGTTFLSHAGIPPRYADKGMLTARGCIDEGILHV